MQDAGSGLAVELGLVRQAAIVDEFGDAPDGVSAHLRLGPVGIEHPHAEVGRVGRHDEHEPVGADPEMPVAHERRDSRGLVDRLLEAVDVDVIVAASVHLGELHSPGPFVKQSAVIITKGGI